MVDADRNEGKEPAEDVISLLKAVLAFQRRLQSDPDSVSNKEIQDECGPDISADEVRNSFRKSTFGRPPKKQRTSARAKLRRRLLWLSRSLEEVESAVVAVCDASGRTNKQNELDELLAAIKVFRDAVSLPSPKEPAEVDPDLFERMFGTMTYAEQPNRDLSDHDD